jgi:hypothetical protein
MLTSAFDPLKTGVNPNYIQKQVVPYREHSPCPLESVILLRQGEVACTSPTDQLPTPSSGACPATVLTTHLATETTNNFTIIRRLDLSPNTSKN